MIEYKVNHLLINFLNLPLFIRFLPLKRIQEEKILAAQKKAQEKRDAERLKKLEYLLKSFQN